MSAQRIVLAGGSGFLGQLLAEHFLTNGCDVMVLTRFPSAHRAAREVQWDAATCSGWASELDGADAVINLTGRTVDCRYTAKNRREIMDSRVNSTRVIGEAITHCENSPRVWLNASTATLYRHNFGPAWDESGTDFSAAVDAKDAFSVQVGLAWEKALTNANTPRTRKVALRTTMVLGLGRNSVFPVLRRLARFGLGGRMGSGEQFVSWIHAEDFCRAIEFILAHDELSGPVNLAAPNPVPNHELMREFRAVAGASFGLPATEWMLEVGAFLLRTETELILKSRRVIPGKLLAAGFAFRFPQLRAALQDLQNRAEHPTNTPA